MSNNIGKIGPSGYVGPKGPPGADGRQGKKGRDGYKGPTGDSGPRGPQGPNGTQGADGRQGDDGPIGVSVQGIERGPDGYEGPQGHDGRQGDNGDDTFGPQGPDGYRGPQGPQGYQGVTGDNAFGEVGDPGDPGDPGDNSIINGAKGPNAINMYNAITLGPSNSTVSIPYSSRYYMCNFPTVSNNIVYLPALNKTQTGKIITIIAFQRCLIYPSTPSDSNSYGNYIANICDNLYFDTYAPYPKRGPAFQYEITLQYVVRFSGETPIGASWYVIND
jgi:hypothetical protein